MLPEKIKETLKKQHYEIAGKNQHSAVQICRWTKKSLIGEGSCYKEKFYGIKKAGQFSKIYELTKKFPQPFQLLSRTQ